MNFLNALRQRRSVYALKSESPVKDAEIEARIGEVLQTLPSAFNSQPVRVAILFGEAHQKLWKIVEAALRAKVPAEAFGATQAKLAKFAGAYGSLLWYCDDRVTKKLQEQFPSYAVNFPIWAEQAEGNAQFAVWCALRELGLGANLQHYNPLIDAEVAKAFPHPDTWRLIAQMPFGAIDVIDPPQPRLHTDEVLKVFR